jgi:hypothetical protein
MAERKKPTSTIAAKRVVKKTNHTNIRHDPAQIEIARRAYEMFIKRGGAHGHDLEDWLAAEQELRGN